MHAVFYLNMIKLSQYGPTENMPRAVNTKVGVLILDLAQLFKTTDHL